LPHLLAQDVEADQEIFERIRHRNEFYPETRTGTRGE
jgi:hypothetical protein